MNAKVHPDRQPDRPSGTRSGRLPLAGISIVERHGALSTDVSRAAVAFAGLLARRFGCQVFRVDPAFDDPMRHWPPHAGGEGALFKFLTAGKSIVPEHDASSEDFLLTDDPDIAALADGGRVILIRPTLGPGSDQNWSELTLLGASGLLDIYGRPGLAPLPLPGHQLAYAAGMAAFDALVANAYSSRMGSEPRRTEVSILDVALWINWKHYMAAVQGTTGVGIDRDEEWRSIRCSDGYIALTFQDKDVSRLAALTGNDFFLSPELSNRATRKKHLTEFNKNIDGWMAGRTRQEIVRRARELLLPIGPILRVEDLVSDAQLQSRQFFVTCADGLASPRLPLHWNGAPLGDGSEICGDSARMGAPSARALR